MNNSFLQLTISMLITIMLISSCTPPCIDNDGDGYGDPVKGSCTFDKLDCDDDPNACGANCNPGISYEGRCADGYDDDCDGTIDGLDDDCAIPRHPGGPSLSPFDPVYYTSNELKIGMEYVKVRLQRNSERPLRMSGMGIPTVKPNHTPFEWQVLQPRLNEDINFQVIDEYVRDYQEVGFTDLVLPLVSWHEDASKEYKTLLNPGNPTPKPTDYQYNYEQLYWNLIHDIVERYDNDSIDDMPGLRHPVDIIEIGVEFSTFEPEPVEDYIRMLTNASDAAHTASDTVQIAHSAFLTTNVFKDHPAPSEMEEAWNAIDRRIEIKSLEDTRTLLDNSDLFDIVDLHTYGYNEMDDQMAWIKDEMDQRGINKPIIFGDAYPNGRIGWGSATIVPQGCNCDNSNPPDPRCDCYNQACGGAGIIIVPTENDDRCQIKDVIVAALNGDQDADDWMRKTVASDSVKMAVIAASWDVHLINLGWAEGMYELGGGGLAIIGTSAWGDTIDCKNWKCDEDNVEYYPNFYAIKQLQEKIRGYESFQRVFYQDPNIRLYRVTDNEVEFWIAWYEPASSYVYGDPIPSGELTYSNLDHSYSVEEMAIDSGQPRTEIYNPVEGVVRIPLDVYPVYITKYG
ncbi:hypothetical protein ACFLZX_04370 [Nanoarchaeota archaeon]